MNYKWRLNNNFSRNNIPDRCSSLAREGGRSEVTLFELEFFSKAIPVITFFLIFGVNIRLLTQLKYQLFSFQPSPNPSRVRQSNVRPLINTAYTYHCATVATRQAFVQYLAASYYKYFNTLMGSTYCRTSQNPRCPQVGVLRSDKFHFYSFHIFQ